jgi:ubiquinone/menaquinone biosynthesis C-methylase UbiE
MTKDPYQRVAGLFDTIFEPMNRGLRLIGVGMFRPRKGMTVLDVGCGTGVHLELYRRFECSLFGIDTSESMLDVAKKRLGEFADLKLANACEMPFKDGSFDLVRSRNPLPRAVVMSSWLCRKKAVDLMHEQI